MPTTKVLAGLGCLAVLGMGVLFGVAWILPLPERLSSPGSQVVSYSNDAPAHVFLSADDKWRIPVQLDDVDPDYIQALIRYEDKRFWMHPGIDPIALLRAVVVNLYFGDVKTGASTITMQLVRVLEPRPRNVFSKITESFRAIQLEVRMSKKEILENYIHFVSFGRNIEGVEAAAWAYFGHSAKSLSPSEICVLLAVPQSPVARYPRQENMDRLKKARDEIAQSLIEWNALPLGHEKGKISSQELRMQIHQSSVPPKLKPLPKEIPHAARWLAKKKNDPVIRTHLDRGVERMAERIFLNEYEGLKRKGIYNGAMVVVENATGKVRALIGNLDFFDEEHGGQIPGFSVARSPGSTLKPLIYAMAIDQGLVLPETKVLDIPAIYTGYAPKNYDGNFQGLVSLQSALSQSLNIPFVRLLQKVNLEYFLGTLRSMGVESLIDQPGYYGLSAAIGGIEMTPLEMAGLYVMLAQGGVYQPLRIHREEPFLKESQAHSIKPLKILSKGSTFLTQQTLALKDRPDFPARRKWTGLPPHIRWKTGTSFGHRDAWSIGFNGRYTVVVWLGNFDQKGSSHLVGAKSAGPILFDMLEALNDPQTITDDFPTDDLKKVELCRLSGHLPGPACPHTHTALALEHNVPTTVCPYHIHADIDDQSGLVLTPTCRSDRSFSRQSFVQWPASLRRWLGDKHQRLPQIPKLAPTCAPRANNSPPKILSPRSGEIHLLIPGLSSEEQEFPLEAETHHGTELSWFINGHYLGTVSPAQRMWWTPQRGQHKIVVTDENGFSAHRKIKVK